MRARCRAEGISRVLMTADPLGGVWTYTIDLARALNRLGIEVILATLGGPLSTDRRREARRLARTTVLESDFRLEWMDDPWDDVDRSGEWLTSLARRAQVDFVHLGTMSHGACTWPVPSVVVAHSCVLSWWDAVRRLPPPPHTQPYRDRIARGLARADLVVAPTRAMLAQVQRFYGPVRHAAVIWNGRHAGGFRPRRKMPCIAGLGRVWDEAKNLEALDRAAAHLSWPVLIGGECTAPHGRTVVLQHANWVGALAADGVRRLLSRAAIYALPARYEPFGLSAVEAALSGCALVLGDIPSLREIWAGAAVFVPPDDPQALRSSLARLIDDDAERHRLARRAHTRAQQLTPERMALEYLARYQAARTALVA